MAPNTRSSSKSKTVSPNTTISSTDTVIGDENNPPPRRFDGIDLLTNLRADQGQRQLNLDLKPPPLPKKVFQNQGAWEIKLKDTKNAQHNNEYVRALEQAANRLVAKAKELVVVHEGNDAACQKPLMEAQEMCIDTIDMLEGDIDKKKYNRKWTTKKAEWKKEYPNWTFDD